MLLVEQLRHRPYHCQKTVIKRWMGLRLTVVQEVKGYNAYLFLQSVCTHKVGL